MMPHGYVLANVGRYGFQFASDRDRVANNTMLLNDFAAIVAVVTCKAAGPKPNRDILQSTLTV
jgi:hypothetical protein